MAFRLRLRRRRTTWNLGPHVATVTYLTSAGAPTVVVPLVAPSDADVKPRGAGGEVFASLPVAGKHMSFDGRYPPRRAGGHL